MADPFSKYWKFQQVSKGVFLTLTNSTLWFANPKTFNDPFDSDLDVTILLESMRSELENYDAIKADLQPYINLTADRLSGRYVYSATEQTAEIRPYEEELMWGHYADGHRGLCLGFSMEKLQDSLPLFHGYHVWPVYYGPEKVKEFVEFMDSAITSGSRSSTQYLKLLDKMSMVKSCKWQYENEVRFMFHHPVRKKERGVLVDFDGKDLENVIFGLRCNDQDQRAIRKIVLTNGWTHVRFWQANRGPDLFGLSFDEIT